MPPTRKRCRLCRWTKLGKLGLQIGDLCITSLIGWCHRQRLCGSLSAGRCSSRLCGNRRLRRLDLSARCHQFVNVAQETLLRPCLDSLAGGLRSELSDLPLSGVIESRIGRNVSDLKLSGESNRFRPEVGHGNRRGACDPALLAKLLSLEVGPPPRLPEDVLCLFGWEELTPDADVPRIDVSSELGLAWAQCSTGELGGGSGASARPGPEALSNLGDLLGRSGLAPLGPGQEEAIRRGPSGQTDLELSVEFCLLLPSGPFRRNGLLLLLCTQVALSPRFGCEPVSTGEPLILCHGPALAASPTRPQRSQGGQFAGQAGTPYGNSCLSASATYPDPRHVNTYSSFMSAPGGRSCQSRPSGLPAPSSCD